MTTKEAYQTIQKIAQARRYNTFAYYTSDDIFQEIWVLCIEALPEYDPNRGDLEHFLNKHVSNRLKNLKRDRYFNPLNGERSKVRINLINALSIYDITFSETDLELISIQNHNLDPLKSSENNEIIDIILENLPEYYVNYFNDLISGKKIPKRIFEELKTCIMDITAYE